MNIEERIKALSKESLDIKEDLKGLLMSIPQNPDINASEKGHRCFTVSFSTLKDNNLILSPGYYDNISQMKFLCKMIDSTKSLDTAIANLRQVVDSGKLKDKSFNPHVQKYIKEVVFPDSE